ncbi:MAG: DUF1080 domain-containing protein [Terriglobia bacterium]|jgi:hypothetical protein
MLIKTPAWKLCIIAIALALPTFAQEWKPLFNGKDLSGWEHVGPGSFVVGQGMLKTEGGMGLLWYTREKFGNVVLRVVYKTSHLEDNSGVFIRIPEPPADPWYAVHHGYEVQILEKPPAGMPEDPYHTTGAIYSLAKALARAAKPPGEWNTMEIGIEGPTTTVVLNGVKVNEYREGDAVPPRLRQYEPERRPRPDSGYIGLQNHHSDAEVYFREVDVRPLTK